jgi:trans-aconitate 2-methyltransferase
MTSDKNQNSIYWDPLCYQENSEPQFKLGMEMLKKYTFKGTEKVLDVGCGNGRITATIANQVPHGHVKGLDYSQEMITFASQSYKAISNVSFIKANANAFSIDEEFNLITSFSALHWVPDQDKVLANFYQHLKRGGTLLISMSRPTREQPLAVALIAVCKRHEWSPYFASFEEPPYMPFTSLPEYEQLLKHSGFDIVECGLQPKRFVYPNREQLALWLQACLPHTPYLPSMKQTPFYIEVVNEYAKNTQQFSPKVIYFYFSWEIVAKKNH